MADDRSIEIAGRRIALDAPPYVIAEISANHNGSFDVARSLIDAAKNSGADAVKLQTYRPDTITLDSDAEEFRIHGGLWDGRTLYDLYREAHTPWEWHEPLFDLARKLQIAIFSYPFDRSAVDFLEDLGAPAYKIASFEIVDLPLIRYAASTGKPLIISTGMADADEIGEAIAAARDAGCRELAILKCVSGYPAPASEYNLRTIADMSHRFECLCGLSDHTLGNATAIAAIAMGAAIIEKHFTIDRSGGGPDDSFSLEPPELVALCRDCHIAWQSLGQPSYGSQNSEKSNMKFRRSLYFVKTMVAGEVITPESVRSVRPGFGLAPKHLESVLGKRVIRDVAANSPVSWGDIVGG